jgi:hypothetical protein
MNTLIGMILGCLLTIGVVYVHDTMATSTVANGNSQTIVNWNVAASEWNHVQAGVRTAWLKLQADYNRG